MAESKMSPEIWKSWDRQGKTEFLSKCSEMLESSKESPAFQAGKQTSDLTRWIYELLKAALSGQVRKESALVGLEELSTLHPDLPSVILDVFCILDAETGGTEISEERLRFHFLLKESEKFLSDRLLKERGEIDTLQEVGILRNRTFYTRFIKVKTKLYYKQRKFNLFREENEGYAKLIVELNQGLSGDPAVTLEAIKSLIGCFNLDPNRVLDVMLESFECNPREHKYFVPLVKSYMPDSKILSDVLGFKYSLYQGPGAEKTPKSLYILTALMLQYKLITLEDLLVWLVPDDTVIVKEWEAEMLDAREQIRKMNVVSVKEKEEKKDEPTEEKESPAEKYEGNQKFGLCEALLNIGAWSVIKDFCKKFPDHYLMEQPTISRAMCNLLHVIVDPLYKTECSLGPKIKGKPVPKPEIILATPQVFTFEELKDNAVSMFQLLGPYIYVDPVLLAKLIRICKSALSKLDLDGKKIAPVDAPMYHEVATLLDESVLPALSFMDGNCCIAEDIWNVLKLYPYTQRYFMYGRWKNDSYQYHAKLMVRRAEAHKKIKSIMKRVSKENIKQIGRLIGKMTHSAPGFIFDYMLLQIQLYDNLIGPVVDSLKYLTSLSYDVLAYCLVECLTQADRERVKHDGTSISLWLQSLSSFCGAIFKKYNIELSGLLQYVANQLKAQRSLDLLILKEIVTKMAGIEAAEEMTSEQLDAMAGGEMLKAEAAYFSQVRNTKKSSTRLREALADQNLAVALCLLMAQQRYNVVYHETENSHLKLVGRLYDQAQDTLVQFGTFLGLTMSVEEYVNRLPPIDSLLSIYHIHTDVAFFLARPMFNHAINNKYDTLRKSDPNNKKLTVAQKQQKYVEAAAAVMGPIVESVKPLHPLKIWEDVSPQFLVTFWSLTMYDLHVPVEAYNKEIAKMKRLAVEALESKDMPSSKSKKEHERYIALQEKIQDEKKKQQEHVDRVLARLRHEKEAWFLSRSAKAAKNETITQFLQLCLFPRCIFTMPDAMYCAKFVHTIHSLKTANFSTLLCYDRLFCDITYSVTSCTENEANRYGRFLNSMLETVMRWHSDKAIFEKECANYPGFVTKYRVSNQFSEACNLVGYENYRHVCHKWHYKITKAMVVCLDSKDYVQIRNSLIILRNILPHFPVLIKLGHIIQKKLEKICDEEKSQRQDLFALAMSYIGLLKAKSSQMIPESSFHQVGDKQARLDAASTASAKPSAGTTPQQNAASADTKSINGDSKEKSSTVKEKRPILPPAKVPVQQSPSSDSDLPPRGSRDERKEKKEKDSHSHSREQHRERDRDREMEPKEKLIKKEKIKDRDEDKWEDEWRDKRKEKEERHRDERFMDSEERSFYSDRERDRDRGRDREREREREKDKERDNSHYSVADDRELSSVSNSSAGSAHRRSQEPIDADRDVKRRKTDASSSSKKSMATPAKTLRRRNVSVRFVDEVEPPLPTLCKSRRLESKENARRVASDKPEIPASGRRRSLRQANEDCSAKEIKLDKIDEELPAEFKERVIKPSALLEDADEALVQVGFQTPRKRKSMVLKAQESASKYSSPCKVDENLTPIKTPRRKDIENAHCTPSRRVSFNNKIIGATPSKLDGTPTKSALKKRESTVGTPKSRVSLQLHDTPCTQSKPLPSVDKTPSRLRSRTRALIEKSIAETESDDGDFSSDEEGSFKPSDESSTSGESSMDEDESPIKVNVKLEHKTKQTVSTPQSRATSSRTSRRQVKEEKDFEITTDAYFETQSAKQITSNNTLSKLRTPRLQQDTLQKLLDDVDAPHHQPITQLCDEYRGQADQWLFSLWEGYSILLYGLGSKRHVIQTFQQEMLSDSNVLLVNGFFPGVVIKNVLDDILTEILDVSDVPSNPLECVDLIESIQSKKQAEPIYLLVHNLDGASFRNDKAQAIFSYLAQMPKVHLIASIDHINAPLLWDQTKLRRFNFVWYDVSTFVAYAAETSYESSLLIQQTGALALSSLNSVFKSLIPNAKKVFILVAKNQLDNAKNQSFSGISFQDLYWKCRAAFLASSDKVLRAQLTEFLDHHLLRARRGTDGVETLVIPIENSILSQFLETFEQEGNM